MVGAGVGMADSLRESHYVPDEVPQADLEYFDRGGDSSREIGWGDTPAVLVVDMTCAFVDGSYPTGRTDTGQAAVEANEELVETARDAGVPVFFTTPLDSDVYPRDYNGTTKSSAGSERTDEEAERWDEGNTIPDPIAPNDDEVVIQKPRASAFFDTHMSNLLHHYGIDTLIVTGMTTSGCVRATVVDGHSSNFRVIVPEECAADRSIISHEISLFDIDMKYADVTPLDDVIETLESTVAVPADD